MRITLFYLFVAYSVLLMQSCTVLYTPNMQNVPLFKEKNEVRVTLGVTNYQAAYAITEHCGIMINGQYLQNKDSFTHDNGTTDITESKYGHIEGGIGYFSPIGKSFIFEIYGGGGTGKVRNDFSFESYDNDTTDEIYTDFYKTSSKTTRFFIQPEIGFSEEFYDIAFSTRIVGLKFSNTIYNSNLSTHYLEDISRLDKPLFMFIEPAITFRIGEEYIKFHLQTMLSFKMNSEPLYNRPFLSMNMGVHINIAKRFKKEKLLSPQI